MEKKNNKTISRPPLPIGKLSSINTWKELIGESGAGKGQSAGRMEEEEEEKEEERVH